MKQSNINEQQNPTTLFDSKKISLLLFNVGGQSYALPIERVVRIIEMVTVIQVSGVSTLIRGIINFRGDPVLVIDMRQRLGFAEQDYGLHTPIMLVDLPDSNHLVGLIVDEVERVQHISTADVDTSIVDQQQSATDFAMPYFAGIVNIDYRMIILLDLSAVLDFIHHPELLRTVEGMLEA
ncbi:chemotaxis protein CheW [Anaerolineales bacterium HSG6]|nr:chemotaxis protein CheW [Anaerolineales bacterium HSG6]